MGVSGSIPLLAALGTVLMKKVGNYRYVHRSNTAELTPALQTRVLEAQALVPDDAWQIVRVHRKGDTVMFAWVDDWWGNPHPAVHRTVLVGTSSLRNDRRYRGGSRPIYHRKEKFISESHPLWESFRALSVSEEAAGVLNRQDIGTVRSWGKVLASKGLILQGHHLEPLRGVSTAVARKVPSAPMRFLGRKGFLVGRGLDFGCGRGFDAFHFGMTGYDPHWRPERPQGLFELVTCNYVLNVITPEAQAQVLDEVLGFLAPGGSAYFSVRRDLPQAGKPGRGCFQRFVELDLDLVVENRSFAIYRMAKP